MNIPGGRALVEVTAQDKSDAQCDGNRGQKQVGHVHHHL
jgi:hypothetical protein